MLVEGLSTIWSTRFDVLMPKSANSSSLNIGGRSAGSSNQFDGEVTDPDQILRRYLNSCLLIWIPPVQLSMIIKIVKIRLDKILR
jgi:hypothetical protein